MKLAKINLEFEVPEAATKEMVEKFLYDQVAILDIENGASQSEKEAIADNLDGNDSFDVTSIEFESI